MFAWLHNTEPLLWRDNADPELWYESREANDIADPIEPAEAKEATLSIEVLHGEDAALGPRPDGLRGRIVAELKTRGADVTRPT